MKQQTETPTSYHARAPVNDPYDWEDPEYSPHHYELPSCCPQTNDRYGQTTHRHLRQK